MCSVESKSNLASSQTTEFGAPPKATSDMITVDVKSGLEFEPNTLQVGSSIITKNGKNKEEQFGDNVRDSIPYHHPSKGISQTLTEVINKIKIQRIVLGVILCTLTIGISVPTGIFIARILLDEEGDGSAIEFQIHQNYCRIHNSPTDIDLIELYHESCDVYDGSICDTYLQSGGRSNATTLQSVITSEQDLVTFFNVLDNNPIIVTEECNKAAKPLICHYTYPFCNNGSYQFPTKEECEYVRDVSCATEWQIALAIVPDTLPNCDLLVAMDEELEIQSNVSMDDVPICPTHFKLFCNETCLPLCSSFSDLSESVTSARRLVDLTASILGIIGGILLITISVFRRDSMFKYPTIFVVYSSLCPMVLGVLLLITYYQRDLYCTSEVLTEAINHPSTFCRLAGALTHFTIMLNVFFWFLHVFHLYLNVLFPLKFLLLKDKRWEKRLHLTELIASIGFASLGPATVWLSNNDYSTFSNPPLLCLPVPNSMLLYALCLPILLLLIIGVNLIATVVWALLKRYCHFKGTKAKRQRRVFNCTMAAITPEVKMLILLCYFVVFTSVLSAHVIVSIQDTKPITENLYAYFVCQMNGANPNCDKLQAEFRQHLMPNLISTTFIMIGLINWVYLIFPIHYKDIEYVVSRATNGIYCLHKPSNNSTIRSRNNSSV